MVVSGGVVGGECCAWVVRLCVCQGQLCFSGPCKNLAELHLHGPWRCGGVVLQLLRECDRYVAGCAEVW